MLDKVRWIDVAAMKTSSYGNDEEEDDEANAGIDSRVRFSARRWRKGLQMEILIV